MQALYRSIKYSVERMIGRLRSLSGATLLGSLALTASSPPVHALLIIPTFDSTITNASNAADIENAINTSIGTVDALYGNSITVSVDFNLAPGSFLGVTNPSFVDVTYTAYTNALKANSAENPANTVLATAIANLSKGNNASGSSDMAITQAQRGMLGLGSALGFDATVTLSSTQPLDYTRPIPTFPPTEYDAIGVIEHELDEVLGGGGAGSTLNARGSSCLTNPSGPLCNEYGSLDLYRYSAPNTPSFTTSALASSYFSINGGVTNIVGFNQNRGLTVANWGDFGDWGPSVTACNPSGFGGPDAFIQDAFTCNNQQRQDYTTLSPEFTMLEAIGWDPAAVPEVGTLTILGTALLGLAAARRRRRWLPTSGQKQHRYHLGSDGPRMLSEVLRTMGGDISPSATLTGLVISL